MISLDAYKFINMAIAARPPIITDKIQDGSEEHAVFAGGNERIIVIRNERLCRAVLTSHAFHQPRIAGAIAQVLKSEEASISIIEHFLNQNPMQKDGKEHSRPRQTFMAALTEAEAAVAPLLSDLAQQIFAMASANPEKVTLQVLAGDYVDGAIALIIRHHLGEDLRRDTWSGSASSIMEFFHSRSQLKEKEIQVKNLVREIARAGKEDITPLLLSYVLQGRDPLIGTLSAFSLWLSSLPADERASQIRSLGPRQMFARSAPVNYISRIAVAGTKIGDIEFLPGDQIILMLPWTVDDAATKSGRSLVFGAGKHICAGQALSLQLASHWITAVQSAHENINWGNLPKLEILPSVFLQFKGAT